MDNNHGAGLFCEKIGLYSGGTTRKLTAGEEKLYHPKTYYDDKRPYLIGSCKADDIWPDCTVDCNIKIEGEGCDFDTHDKTKEQFLVCRDDKQSKMFYLFCNGSYNLPLSSCYGKFDVQATKFHKSYIYLRRSKKLTYSCIIE